MGIFIFEPICVNASAPGGACVLRTFADVGAFMLNAVDLPRRLSPHWNAVAGIWCRLVPGQGGRRSTRQTRDALAAEGWLADGDGHGP